MNTQSNFYRESTIDLRELRVFLNTVLLSTCTVYVLPISCIHSPKVLTPCREYAIISESSTDFVDWLQAIHKMWSCSF